MASAQVGTSVSAHDTPVHGTAGKILSAGSATYGFVGYGYVSVSAWPLPMARGALTRRTKTCSQCQARIPMTTVSDVTNQGAIDTSPTGTSAVPRKEPLSDFQTKPRGTAEKTLIAIMVAFPL